VKTEEIKRLAEHSELETLKQAETALLEGHDLPLQVNGEDEGEQLTHILSAIWVLEHIKNTGCTLPLAMRDLARKVRGSISE